MSSNVSDQQGNVNVPPPAHSFSTNKGPPNNNNNGNGNGNNKNQQKGSNRRKYNNSNNNNSRNDSNNNNNSNQKFFNPKYDNNNLNKMTLDQIQLRYPDMIRVNLAQAKKNATSQNASKVLQQVYQFAKTHNHQQPQVITKKLRNGDSQHLQMYSKLRTFCTRRATTQKLKKFLASKIIHQYSVKMKVPHKQALCTLLMDDFFSDLKQFGSKAFDRLKQYYHQNKQSIHDMLGGLVTSVFPQSAPLVYGLKSAFGGQLMSQSPYAIDLQYMQSLFSGNGTSPAPRRQNHYMYHMASCTQYPVTTNASGQTCFVLNAYSCIYGAASVNGQFLPFVQNVNVADATKPYSTLSTLPGPFNSQFANIVNYAVDVCKINFINTQSTLNVKGKVTTSVFYQAPNASWFRNNITGLYNTSTISITDNDLITNTGYFRRFAQKQCQTLTRVSTLLPQQNRDDCISSYTYSQTGNQFMSTGLPFIVFKCSGCNPNTQIGTMYIQIGISIQPIAALRNILKVTPRGSYQGVYRAIKQCRKLRIPLQFLKQNQASFLFKQAFNEIDFKQFQYNIGNGQYVPIPGLNKMKYPQTPGLCLHDSILAIGVQNNLQPYDTLLNALKYTTQILRLLSGKQIIIYSKQIENNFVYLNQVQKHAVAVTLHQPTKFKQFIIQNQILIAYYNVLDKSYCDYTQQFLQLLKYKQQQFVSKNNQIAKIGNKACQNKRKLLLNSLLKKQLSQNQKPRNQQSQQIQQQQSSQQCQTPLLIRKNCNYYKPNAAQFQNLHYRSPTNQQYNYKSQKNLTRYGIQSNPGPRVKNYANLNKSFRDFIKSKIPQSKHYMTYIYNLIVKYRLKNKRNLQQLSNIHNNVLLGIDLQNVNDSSVRNNLDLVKVQYAKDLQQFQNSRDDYNRVTRIMNRQQQILKKRSYLSKLPTSNYSQFLLREYEQSSKANPAYSYQMLNQDANNQNNTSYDRNNLNSNDVPFNYNRQINTNIKQNIILPPSVNLINVISNIIVDADTIKQKLILGGIQLNPGPSSCH